MFFIFVDKLYQFNLTCDTKSFVAAMQVFIRVLYFVLQNFTVICEGGGKGLSTVQTIRAHQSYKGILGS